MKCENCGSTNAQAGNNNNRITLSCYSDCPKSVISSQAQQSEALTVALEALEIVNKDRNRDELTVRSCNAIEKALDLIRRIK